MDKNNASCYILYLTQFPLSTMNSECVESETTCSDFTAIS